LLLPTHHCLLLLLQVLNDSRIKHYFDATDMQKQVCHSNRACGAASGSAQLTYQLSDA
jgi:hypothetical protein